MATESRIEQILKIMRPKAVPVRLVRIGGDRDGAYLIPDDISGIEACFSPGVNNKKDFEDELTIKHRICCHMCDYTSDEAKMKTPMIANMQTFKKKWLDTDESQNSISLDQWVASCTHDESTDLMLQMDIEGAEYRNILSTSAKVIRRFRIIVIELHGLRALKRPDLSEKQIAPLLTRLDSSHVCVHAHPNNCCGEFLDQQTGMNIPNVIELTFYRRDRFNHVQGYKYPVMLPHPLDISRNARGKPPIHLNENWISPSTRSIESKIKVLEDHVDYINWRLSSLGGDGR